MAQLVEATTPEMGQAALAMIDTWVFTPPTKKDGTPCFAGLTMEHDFRRHSISDVPVTPEALDILHDLKKSPEKFAAMAELDAAPKPLSRRPPVYPSALRKAGEAGTALIEFFIDIHGDAQVPHIISCSAPEFGYAAVQAVATWRFEPARQGGKAVIARVQIPIKFAPGGK
jgi:TonB family protein